MKIGTQKFGDEVAATNQYTGLQSLWQHGTYISSSGEMKISLRQMIWKGQYCAISRQKVPVHPHFHVANASTVSIHGMFAWIERGY